MAETQGLKVAIVDYGMGNLFSVKHALEWAGLSALVTSSREDVTEADAVVLPGVGAFGDAIDALHRLDLVSPLREVASSDRVLVGICLGMQLLMTESDEFGTHRGLDIIQGSVVRLNPGQSNPGQVKVPHVGWTRIFSPEASGPPGSGRASGADSWSGSPQEGVPDGEFMYFVHSFYARPQDPCIALSYSRLGDLEFCSSLTRGNVFGCQFHPERSGPAGLRIYENLASWISRTALEESRSV